MSLLSTKADILGQRLPLPQVVAPTAVAGLLWHDSKIALAKAAARAGIPFCVSTQSITAIERIATLRRRSGSTSAVWQAVQSGRRPLRQGSDPAAVDDIVLVGAGPGLLRSEE
ncbi:alpha-hydroxy-acid oxidizing protein [Bosea vestrisii]|uniref:alpha-hydroxy-acid oxidizing protein n=1 Tax=Bosea vestrisii TaxID=151416 RepID=UPI003D766EC9